MCDDIFEINPDSQELMLKASEQQPGEPDKWYRRFQHYCELGSGRSLLRCYQLVMAEQDTLRHGKPGGNGQRAKRAPKRKHTPATWRQYARRYEWARRAKAYDQAQKERAAQAMEQTLLRASDDMEEVRQFYLNLMRGWIRSPEGEMIAVTDIYQRRMAAKALQNLAAILWRQLASEQEVEEGDEIEIKEIRAHQPQESEGESQGDSHDAKDEEPGDENGAGQEFLPHR